MKFAIPTLVQTVVCILLTIKENSAIAGYYWRDYIGDIPADAVLAGKNFDGKNIYIGQAYREYYGMIPVQIFPGLKEVYTYCDRVVQKTDWGIKILCGHPSSFQWLSTNASTFDLDMLDKKPVIGGFQASLLYPGRITYEGELKIGKIWPGSKTMYFHHKGKELDVLTFQVLITKPYVEKPCRDLDIDLRSDNV